MGDVITAHDIALTFGGAPGVRDMASIASAIGRPHIGYYRRIFQKAAALTESLARNHGFTDGNKRTALLIVDLFIHLSGYELRGVVDVPHQELEELIVRIATNHPPFPEIEDWFRLRLKKRLP